MPGMERSCLICGSISLNVKICSGICHKCWAAHFVCNNKKKNKIGKEFNNE